MFGIITGLYAAASVVMLLTPFYCYQSDVSLMKRSRILSFTNACVTSSVGVAKYIQYTGTFSEFKCYGTSVDDFMAIFFIVYLSLDLIIGTLYYTSQMSIGAGYIHHSIFIPVVSWIYQNNLTACSSLIYILEVPTILLSLKYLIYPRFSQTVNVIFGLLFFKFRILFLFRIVIELLSSPTQLDIEKIYFLPIVCCMITVHIFWFRTFLSKFALV